MDTDDLVCVRCGDLWPFAANRCPNCGAFCAWGKAKDASPDSWIVLDDGSWVSRPPPEATL